MSGEEESVSENEIEEIIESNEVEEAVHVNESEEPGNGEGATNENEKQDVKIKRVRNPQPKLNAERLKGPRGIQTIEGIFEKIKFKGRGHEEEDLKTLLQGYQYWCHRLFPKFMFEDSIERIERLGTKKLLQTHIKKIRMNMLFLDDDEIVGDDEVNEEESEPRIDPFNALLPTESQQPISTTINSQDDELSEEQLELIRLNRERALKRRQELIEQKNRSQIHNQSTEASGSCVVQEVGGSVEQPSEYDRELSLSSPVMVSEQESATEQGFSENLSLNKKLSQTTESDENMDLDSFFS